MFKRTLARIDKINYVAEGHNAQEKSARFVELLIKKELKINEEDVPLLTEIVGSLILKNKGDQTLGGNDQRTIARSLTNIIDELQYSFHHFTSQEWLDFFRWLDVEKIDKIQAMQITTKGTNLSIAALFAPLFLTLNRPIVALSITFALLIAIGNIMHNRNLEIYKATRQTTKSDHVQVAFASIVWLAMANYMAPDAKPTTLLLMILCIYNAIVFDEKAVPLNYIKHMAALPSEAIIIAASFFHKAVMSLPMTSKPQNGGPR